MRRRVVITGVGMVSSLAGGGRDEVVDAFTSAASTDPERIDRAFARLIEAGEARRLSRVSQLTLAAARLAVQDAALDADGGLAFLVGTELGDLRSTIQFADGYLDRGPAGLSPLLFPNTVMNTMAAASSIALAARELSLTINAPTVAGELAVARAAAAVAAGRTPAALAGGVDDLDPAVAAVLAEAGGFASRGEAAAFVTLESLDGALARGAHILGEVLGTASGSLPAPAYGVGRAGTSSVIPRALAAASMHAEEIRLVCTSENGDARRDAWEARVLDLAVGGAPRVAFGRRMGQSSALGPLKVLAAAMQAPALVHGLARGGMQGALVIGPPPAIDRPA